MRETFTAFLVNSPLPVHTRSAWCGPVFAKGSGMRTTRIMAALVLSLSCALGACVQRSDTSGETVTDAAPGATVTASEVEESPIGTAAQAVEENCLQACLDASDRVLIYCGGLPTPKARELCRAAAMAALAVCIARCPD